VAKSTLEKTINDFYDKLDAKDANALKRIAIAHQRTIDKLGNQLAIVTAKIQQDALLGLDSGTYLLQRDRLAAFITDANAYFGEFGSHVGLSLTQAQKETVTLAQSFIPNVVQDVNGPFPNGIHFARLPEPAIQQFVGTLGDGSPVRTLTDSFGTEASKTLNRLLLEGVSTGINPLTIAQQMSDALPTLGIARANTFARTEMMRAYRGAATKVMKANKDIIKGWKWYSALDKNTCPVCWALHGKVFPPDELMATHPNCRCVHLPVTKTWQELGYNVPEPALSQGMSLSGEELFAGLDEETKQFILGKAGYTGYKNGIFKLEDFIQNTYSQDWGYGRTTRSISSMVGKTNTKTLTAGKVPRGVAVRPSKLDLPAEFDPFDLVKKQADDALQMGRISQADYDIINNMIDAGQFVNPAEVEDVISGIYDIEVQFSDDLLLEATKIDALEKQAIDDIVTALENNPTLEELSNINDIMKSAIQTKKDVIQAEFDDAINQLLMEKQKAQLYGSTNQNLLDLVVDNVNNGVYKTKREVLDATDLISKEVKLNDPYAKLTAKLNEAKKLNYSLDAQASAIDVSSLTIQEAKDQLDIWSKLIVENTPLDYSTVALHPKFSDLQKLLNDGKITQTEYKTLVQDAAHGQYTNKTFTEAIESLEQQAAKKVTKSSYELLEELNNSGYPPSVKKDLANKYNTKQINKEQMQMYIDAAPAPSTAPVGGIGTAPSPVGGSFATTTEAMNAASDAYYAGTLSYKDFKAIQKVYYNIGSVNPWGKYVNDDYFKNYVEKKLGIAPNKSSVTTKGLPYKKHMVDLDNLLKTGTIDQSTYDNVILQYQTGKIKNKQIEQLIQNWKVGTGQAGGSTYVPGSVQNFNWDYQGWMNGRGAANNAINKWTAAEKDALNTYTGGSYSAINGLLRRAGGDLARATSNATSYERYYIDTIKNMDSYFSKARITEDVKVYRNTSVSGGPWSTPKVGDILTDQGFTSTSVKPNWSGFKSGGCAKSSLEIVALVRRGTPAAWVMPISQVRYEEELLINRGTKFVVTEVVEKRPPSANCLGDYVIYGEYVP
jgi:SPP1 gp7 family putative phage head morphogenesis protein